MGNFSEQPEQKEQVRINISRQKKRKIYSYILLLVFIGVVVWLLQGIYLPIKPSQYSADGAMIVIEKGDGLMDIAEKLKQAEAIRSKYLFIAYVLLANKQNSLMAGAYRLKHQDMNVPRMMTALSEGKIAREKITVIEGWTLRDIGWKLENLGMFQAEELFEAAGFPAVDYQTADELSQPLDFSEEFSFLKEKPARVGLEGYLFPDTYEIEARESIEEIVKKMLSNFQDKVLSQPELSEEIAGSGKSLFEVLTMASLLEKEVKTFSDKQIVSGILWKRLQNGWKLQVDATLTYLFSKPSQELTAQEIESESPYNTYQYYGLPLGPICNPGIESIRAAIDFEESPYWFYLTAPEGETVFSKTLEEHNSNREQYLK